MHVSAFGRCWHVTAAVTADDQTRDYTYAHPAFLDARVDTCTSRDRVDWAYSQQSIGVFVSHVLVDSEKALDALKNTIYL